jgi:membrane associated rhomboid family serine protease
MEAQQRTGPLRPLALFLKAGFLNALLVTAISAFMIALVSGAGTEYELGNSPVQIRSLLPNPWELGKTAVLLCPITAVSYGSFGLLAGSLGCSLVFWRRRRICYVRRLLAEAAVVGLLLAVFFPLLDVTMNWTQEFFCVMFGAPCAMVCAFVFRRHFLTAA